MASCTRDTKEIINGNETLILFFEKAMWHFKSNRKNINMLVEMLSGIEDFRLEGMIKYRLENILALCLYLALKDEFHSFYHAALYIKVHESTFVKMGLIEKGKCPSHDTLQRVYSMLDSNEYRDAIIGKIKEFMVKMIESDPRNNKRKRLLQVDGKEFRGSGRHDTEKHEGKGNINVFNIYDYSYGVCISSTPLLDKDSEIKECKRLLRKFNLSNTVVTADALHCQKDIAEIILSKSGEYVLRVKDNQKNLKKEIKRRFKEFNKRTVKIKYNNVNYSFLLLKKEYQDSEFPGVKIYGKALSNKRKNSNGNNKNTMYFISSSDNIELVKESFDLRWAIEDDLHKFKDDFCKEDECTFTNKNAVKNMAVTNNIVHALYKIAAGINNESIDTTKIRYKEDPIELLSMILPLLEGHTAANLIKENMLGTKKNRKK